MAFFTRFLAALRRFFDLQAKVAPPPVSRPSGELHIRAFIDDAGKARTTVSRF